MDKKKKCAECESDLKEYAKLCLECLENLKNDKYDDFVFVMATLNNALHDLMKENESLKLSNDSLKKENISKITDN